MLIIRNDQLGILNQYMRHHFSNRMLSYITNKFPQIIKTKNDQAVKELIEEGIERAGRYGIVAEYDVARFVDLMFRFAEDFDTHPSTPWAQPILMNHNLDPRVKMDRLWEEARKNAAGEGSGGS